MAAKTYYLASNMLDGLLRGGSLPPNPGPISIALNTTASTPTTPGTEEVDANYSRQAMTFTVAGPTYSRNTTTASFYGAGRAGNVTASATIVEIAIYDNLGNELYYAPIGSPPTVNTGDTAVISASNVVVTESGAATTYLNQGILGALLSNISFGSIATVYCALNTTTSTATVPGTEVVDANYTRQPITFAVATNGVTSNSAPVDFFAGGAASGPYTIVEAALYDAATSGHELYFGALTVPRTVSATDTLSIGTSNFTVTES
jgi:hypothetical protein